MTDERAPAPPRMADVKPRLPLATYRLQLGRDLTFDDAARLAPYLAALGISDCYTSPFFETASQSSHGYDVSDHNRLRGELGGDDTFARFATALREHSLGLLIDLVPNHMGIAQNRNACWLDVLENGAASPWAHYFDIDWTPVKPELANKVLLPILGAQYGTALDEGQLRLELQAEGRFLIRYFDTVLPVAPRTYVQIVRHRFDAFAQTLGAEHPAVVALKQVHDLFLTIPHRTETDPERLAARHREVEIARQKFVELLAESADVRDFIEENVRLFNGTPGDARSFDLLDGLLQDQVYRLAYWRVAGEEINYRRFFDINELAAIRMEDPRVFAETHRLVFRLVREGVVTGLRIDHPDGLYAPAEYYRRLQRACYLESARRASEAGANGGEVRDRTVLEAYDAAQQRSPTPLRPFYIVAEKILAAGERLPADWAVHGTTGYEFLNLLNGIFVDRSQARAMDQIYTRWIHDRPAFAEIVYQSKRAIMETSMASELYVLGQRLDLISEKHRSSRDFTLASLTQALREVIACFPVYRTYLGDPPPPPEAGPSTASQMERESIARAIAAAKRRTPAMDPSIHDWLQDLLMLKFPPWADEADRRERTDFVMRVQQITGPVTAKGYEDTALYRYHRLVSLNEVGSDPSRFGTPRAEFHEAMAARLKDYAHGLSATATHDTKRGEDVRARINVLSEIPGEWRKRVTAWQKLNRKHRTAVDGQPVPGPNEEYLIYQTLVGAWPISFERLRDYLLKAVHEAKVHTSWINPNARYDEAMARFAEALLDGERSKEFLADFTPFQARVAHFGAFNALGQTLVKITAPGVPDFYQGSELWDLALVDPDNRRSVDFGVRQRLLDALVAEARGTDDLTGLARDLVKAKEDGRVKLFLIWRALGCRRAQADLFLTGDYRPLTAAGPLAEHVCAFARLSGGGAAVTVVPRLLARRGIEDAPLGAGYWGGDTTLAIPAEGGTRFRNALTGERLATEAGALPLAGIFGSFPVALLMGEG